MSTYQKLSQIFELNVQKSNKKRLIIERNNFVLNDNFNNITFNKFSVDKSIS